MRVPRKKKKLYKNMWAERLGYKVKIQKSTIEKTDSWDGKNVVWGCVVYPFI